MLLFARFQRWIVAGLLLGTGLPLVAADYSRSLFTRVWRSHEGMPGNEITGIAQDGSGYLWLAYPNGLAKFDGVRFQNVPLPVPRERNFNIQRLLRTAGDQFWLALDGGTIIHITPTKTNLLTRADGLSGGRPLSIAESRDGAIWVGYSDSSACRIIGRSVTRFTSQDGLNLTGSCRIATDIDGVVWFAQTGRVGIWNGKRFETVLTLPARHVRLCRKRAGGIWICGDTVVFSYKQGGQLIELARLQTESGNIAPELVVEDRTGAVWLGTIGEGLFRCVAGKAEPVETSQRTILRLYEDRGGSIWAGTAGGGLNRVRPRILDLQTVESGLPFDSARSMCVDGTGRIWVVARNGRLAWFENGTWQLCGPNEGWPGEQATCISTDAQGAVWIGTYQAGNLYRWQDGVFTRFDRQTGLKGDTVRLLLADHQGGLWVGLSNPSGLQRLKNGKFQTFELPPQSLAVCTAAQDREGNIWFGTTGGMLLRVQNDRLTDESGRALHSSRAITAIEATADGSLWIAYLEAGLGRLRTNSFRLLGPECGIPGGRICDIVPDAYGGLWCSTGQGILRVSQSALDAVADNQATHVNAIYHGSDELLSLQGVSSFFPGAVQGPDNTIFFPLLTGMVVVHPDRIALDRHPPQVVIESAIANDQVVPIPEQGESVRFQPGLRKLEFQFTAPSFFAPDSIRFRHQLEGVDEDWIDLGTQRRVTFTRLPPGHYHYRVTACNYAGLWNEVGAQLSFQILPFFWQTTAFQSIFLVSIVLSLGFLVRYISTRPLRQEVRRLQQEAALDRERARIAKDIHDDLGASLTQISLLGELAIRHVRPMDVAAEHVRKLAQAARQAFTDLDEIVWAVNPRNDTLAHLLDYLAQFALDFLSPTQLRCRLDFPSQPPAMPVSAEIRHTLYLVVKEALNNVVKHARAAEIRIHASLLADSLELIIEDDGVGFDPSARRPEADGLENMRQRLQDAGGRFKISSRLGAGTMITVTIPLSRHHGGVNPSAANPES